MAIKKILTDLNTDGSIGLGKDPAHYIDIDKTSVANDETRGINIELSKENTSGAGFASNVYGVKAHSVANSSETVVNIGGVWTKAEHTGSGQTYYLTGTTSRAYHSGSGNSSSIAAVFAEGKVGGTGAGSHGYLIGINSIAKMDNANADVDYLQGQHCTVQLNAGEVTGEVNPLILDVDHTGGTISGDLTYLRIQNDTLDSAVQGTARAIYSLSLFPSEFAGSIQSPQFNIVSEDNYLKLDNDKVQLYGDAGVVLESGDGVNFTIDEQITITSGYVVSDSPIESTSFVKTGGTSAQFLKADGSVDSTAYTAATIPKVEYQTLSTGLAENAVVTLPNSLAYTVSSGGYEYLEIFLDGIRLNRTIDFEEVSTTTIRVLMNIPQGSVLTYKSLQ